MYLIAILYSAQSEVVLLLCIPVIISTSNIIVLQATKQLNLRVSQLKNCHYKPDPVCNCAHIYIQFTTKHMIITDNCTEMIS